MTRIERPTATIARFLPRRLAMRRMVRPGRCRFCRPRRRPRPGWQPGSGCRGRWIRCPWSCKAWSPGENLAHEHRVGGGGKPGHVHPDLGDDDRGGDRSDAGYLIQPGRRCRERDQVRLDLLVEGGDIGRDVIDAVEHPGEQEPVMIIDVAVERVLEECDLGAHPATRHLRQRAGRVRRRLTRPSSPARRPRKCRRRPPTA